MIETPMEDSMLPLESEMWNGQTYTVFKQHLAVSAPVAIHLGSFQRAAQAATILHRAHRCNVSAKMCQDELQVAEAERVDESARALLDAMLAQAPQWEVFCDAIAMCMR